MDSRLNYTVIYSTGTGWRLAKTSEDSFIQKYIINEKARVRKYKSALVQTISKSLP